MSKQSKASKLALALEVRMRRLATDRLVLMTKTAKVAEEMLALASELSEQERYKLSTVLYDASNVGHREGNAFHDANRAFHELFKASQRKGGA